jgi:hypothetical protein
VVGDKKEWYFKNKPKEMVSGNDVLGFDWVISYKIHGGSKLPLRYWHEYIGFL